MTRIELHIRHLRIESVADPAALSEALRVALTRRLAGAAMSPRRDWSHTVADHVFDAVSAATPSSSDTSAGGAP